VNTILQPSGAASKVYPVGVGGEIKITVAVTAEDGTSTAYYTVYSDG